jgi:hypothetical protein
MITLHPTTQLLASWDEPIAPDEAELAAVAFLARDSGRTPRRLPSRSCAPLIAGEGSLSLSSR